MSVENYIKSYVNKISEKCYITPEIPEKKINNAINSMAKNINPEYVLSIVDSTVFGSAKEGIIFTGESIHLKYIGEKKECNFKDILKVEYEVTKEEKKNGKISEQEHVYFHMSNNEKIKMPSKMLNVNYQNFANLINGIIEEGGENKDYKTTSQTLPLASMDKKIKNTYIKLICNFAYSDDSTIDSKEYAEIISLIVRIDYDSESRLNIRHYMCDDSQCEKNSDLIECLNSEVPEGSLDIIKKSLIKDILYIYKLKNDINNWKKNGFITSLQNDLEIKDEQIDLIIEAIKNDEEILSKRKNDSEIKKSLKDLAAKAGAVGVPLAAIYFSGSVVGMSAAGITSGLATLGMGGILGFSGMVTGIGAVVLIGVGTYSGLKKITGISELENNKQREMMLQSIIKNSQKSLNYLIEDVNEISSRLMKEINKGLLAEKSIKKLSTLLAMMTKSAQSTTEKIDYAECETIISRVPKILDIVRLKELTNEPTKEKLGEFVVSCYFEKKIEEDERTELVLNDKLPLNRLEQLDFIFESIGYRSVKGAALASAKGIVKNLWK